MRMLHKCRAWRADLICSIAQKIPEFLDMVCSSLHFERKEPWAVQMMAAPTPSIALTEYRSQVFGHKNDIMNELFFRCRRRHRIEDMSRGRNKSEIVYQLWIEAEDAGIKNTRHNPHRQIDGAKIPKIINLPISHCTNQHGTPRSGEGNYRRSYPVAYGKYCINNRQADVAIAGERGIVPVNAVQDSFLRWKFSH